MRKLADALKLEPRSAELRAEINERAEVRSRMVGTLYPSILGEEIRELESRYWAHPEPKDDPT